MQKGDIMKTPPIRSIALLLTLFGASTTQAHMPYVLPTLFDVGKGDHITVQSAFAEDAFLPEVAMRDAPFHLVGPDGKDLPIGPVMRQGGVAGYTACAVIPFRLRPLTPPIVSIVQISCSRSPVPRRLFCWHGIATRDHRHC